MQLPCWVLCCPKNACSASNLTHPCAIWDNIRDTRGNLIKLCWKPEMKPPIGSREQSLHTFCPFKCAFSTRSASLVLMMRMTSLCIATYKRRAGTEEEETSSLSHFSFSSSCSLALRSLQQQQRPPFSPKIKR